MACEAKIKINLVVLSINLYDIPNKWPNSSEKKKRKMFNNNDNNISRIYDGVQIKSGVIISLQNIKYRFHP